MHCISHTAYMLYSTMMDNGVVYQQRQDKKVELVHVRKIGFLIDQNGECGRKYLS